MQTHSYCPFPWCLSALFIKAGPNSKLWAPHGKDLGFNSCPYAFVNICPFSPFSQQEVLWDKGKEKRISFSIALNSEFCRVIHDLHRRMVTYKSTPVFP